MDEEEVGGMGSKALGGNRSLMSRMGSTRSTGSPRSSSYT
jgi:hypothetical protein